MSLSFCLQYKSAICLVNPGMYLKKIFSGKLQITVHSPRPIRLNHFLWWGNLNTVSDKHITQNTPFSSAINQRGLLLVHLHLLQLMTEDQEKTNSLHWLQNPPFFSAEFLILSQLAETCEPFHELAGRIASPPCSKISQTKPWNSD